MGTDKALIELDGVAMAVRVARALAAAGATEVLAIGGDAPGLVGRGLVVHPDEWPGSGPLGATVTALGLAREHLVLVTSCDLLHPSPVAMAATVRALAEHPGAVAAVPVVDGHRQVTHAAWHVRARPALVAAYAGGERSLRRAAADLLVFELAGIEPEELADADLPSDLPSDLRSDGHPDLRREPP